MTVLSTLFSSAGLIAIATLVEHSRRESRIIDEDMRTAELLADWRLANPTLGVGDSDYATMLVLRRIASFERFAKCEAIHSIERIAYIGYLYRLLDEHGPEPPRKRGRTKAPRAGPFRMS